jgi:hypothetical protein
MPRLYPANPNPARLIGRAAYGRKDIPHSRSTERRQFPPTPGKEVSDGSLA